MRLHCEFCQHLHHSPTTLVTTAPVRTIGDRIVLDQPPVPQAAFEDAPQVSVEGHLAGIFTQGDFARHLATHPNLLELAVASFLTAKPITVQAGGLAVEVLHILEKNRIDDLVVVDDTNRPIGMVDTQDLARFRLV